MDKLLAQHERNLIGSVIMDNNHAIFIAAQVGITPDSFAGPNHALIWTAIQQLATASRPIDQLSIQKQLFTSGHKIEPDLDAMVDSALTSANTEYYAQAVKDAERGRELHEILASSTKMLSDGSSTAEVLERFTALTISLTDATRSEIKKMAALREEKIAQWKSAQRNGFVGVPFTMPTINKYLGGWRKSVMGIIAGFRGEGKSTIVRQECLALAERGVKVALFTLEDPPDIAAACIAGNKAGISTFGLDTGTIYPAAIDTIDAAWQDIGNIPLWIINNASSINQIIATMRLMKMRHGIDIAFIDHIQFITPYRINNASRNDTLAQYSGQIIQVAKALQIPIICASQLSRDSEKKTRKPQLSDLRDSGALEQDARQILLLYYDSEREMHILEVAKNNYGQSRKAVYIKRIDGKQRFEEQGEV